MTTSNRLGITELAETQNSRSVTINEAIAKLEAGATFFAAIQVLVNAPPASPVEGDLYVVGTAGSGAWSGHNENVTVYYNAAWLFFTPIIMTLFATRAPASLRGTMIGVNATAVFAGSVISGRIGGLYERVSAADFWLLHAAVCAGGCLLILLMAPAIRLLLGDDQKAETATSLPGRRPNT